MPLDAATHSLAHAPIECDYLDGENVEWTRRYIQQCESRLETTSCDRHAGYLRTEIAQYRELLLRFQKL